MDAMNGDIVYYCFVAGRNGVVGKRKIEPGVVNLFPESEHVPLICPASLIT